MPNTWGHPCATVRYGQNLTSTSVEATKDTHNLGKLQMLYAQEAKGLAGVVAAAAKGDEAAEKGPHEAALAALAATRAAAANLRVRCGRCEACTATQGSARRCLVNRAAAAAAAGHSGAQVCCRSLPCISLPLLFSGQERRHKLH